MCIVSCTLSNATTKVLLIKDLGNVTHLSYRYSDHHFGMVKESKKQPPLLAESRTVEAARHIFCGGIAGSVAKTVTAPFSRLTILYQVHSLVTTKGHRPKFAMTLREGWLKIVERGGIISMWRGNLTSVLHRFPYSGINFYCYESVLDILRENHEEPIETSTQLVRRFSHRILEESEQKNEFGNDNTNRSETQAYHKFLAGAIAGCSACVACYPLDLVRTRLTTELEGREHYRGIVDAVRKIYTAEGVLGFYSGLAPTLAVAVPNLAISFSVYGTMKGKNLRSNRLTSYSQPAARLELSLYCVILITLTTFFA